MADTTEQDDQTIEVVLDKMDKETSGTYRFVLGDPDGSEAITSLYVKKFGIKKIGGGNGVPKAIKVTVEAV